MKIVDTQLNIIIDFLLNMQYTSDSKRIANTSNTNVGNSLSRNIHSKTNPLFLW